MKLDLDKTDREQHSESEIKAMGIIHCGHREYHI